MQVLKRFVIQDIIEEVSRRVSVAAGSIAIFPEKGYRAIPFSPDFYQAIEAVSGKSAVFIDGGNAEIIAAPGMSLQLVRNAAVVMSEKKIMSSVKREFYVLATMVEKEGKMQQQARIYEDGKETVVADGFGDGLAAFCESIRKCSEIALGLEQVELGKVIVLDGTLEAANDMEKRHFQALFSGAKEKGAVVSALAKTTALLTESGDSYAALLQERGSEGSWLYRPIVNINLETHQAEMLFVKLHDASNYVFRCEVHEQQKDRMMDVASVLKENANDLTFPGYPYGLVLADKLARVSDKDAAYARTKLFAAAGKKWELLRGRMNAVNAHDVLDGM
jgi:hypothetical protein